MGWEARAWAAKQYGLKPREKAVLMCIADFHNAQAGYAWPSISRIALETGYSVSSVKRAVGDLRLRGLLVVAKQRYFYHSGYNSNRYYLVGHSPDLPIPGKVYLNGGWFDSKGKWEPDFNGLGSI